MNMKNIKKIFCSKKYSIPKEEVIPNKKDDERKYFEKMNLKKKKKLKKAYQKAWENRDFEINKFWQRALFFWGFISTVLIGYTTLLSSDKYELISKNNPAIEASLLFVGLLLSISWYFILEGGKSWQENWESHIDRLEKYISGDIYKVIYIKENERRYSVSKISIRVSWILIAFWIGMIVNHFSHYSLALPNSKDFDLRLTLSLYIPLIISIFLCRILYSASTHYKTDGRGFVQREDIEKHKN